MMRFSKWSAAALIVTALPCLADQSMVSEAKGTIANVRPYRNEIVLTETFKNLTFKVNGSTQIQINGVGAKVSDIRPGDAAHIVFERQGQTLFAMAVNINRKITARVNRGEFPAGIRPPRWEMGNARLPR